MHYVNYTLMQNEQCGICWNLEFDKQGDKTHEDLYNHAHSFVPLDYCIKCREPKYDQCGFQTHPENTRDFMQNQNIGMPHKFISGIETKYQEKRKKKRHFLIYIGLVLMGVTAITSVSNLFF